MIHHQAYRVGTRGRVYLTQTHRRELGLSGTGYGAVLAVGLVAREPSGVGIERGRYVTDEVRLQGHGEFTIPVETREYLGVAVGETVLVTARVGKPGFADR